MQPNLLSTGGRPVCGAEECMGSDGHSLLRQQSPLGRTGRQVQCAIQLQPISPLVADDLFLQVGVQNWQ